MGAGDLEPLDLLYTAQGDDEPRLKVGDQASGAGVGQDCAYLATDGFISLPNGPDGTGACATGICWTPGQDRIVIAASDGRYNDKAGTLAAGDRAIVSNCGAYFKLSCAGNAVGLFGPTAGCQVNGGTNTVSLYTALGGLTINGSGVGAAWEPGGGVNVTMNLTSAGLVLAVSSPAGLCSITLGVNGALALVAVPGAGGSPSGVTVNGVPLTVP